MPKMLLVDDEEGILVALRSLFTANDFEVTTELDGEKARERICSEEYDIMISDIRMRPINGIELLKCARAERPSMPVLMLTAFGSRDTAEEAMALGAFGYVLKPFNLEELLITARRALEHEKPLTGSAEPDVSIEKEYQLEDITAETPDMKNVCELIRKTAPLDTPVLISGERGSGKKLVAGAIHALGPRKNNNFLARNCAVLPEPLLELEMFGYMKGAFSGASTGKKGIIEAAWEGTVLFEEIGWMPRNLQAKLCTVLREKGIRRVGGNENIPVDFRLIALTITPFERLVEGGNVLEDLYSLLKADCIGIKPLRERRDDIMPLVHRVLSEEAGEDRGPWTIDPEIEMILQSYSWPGNTKELRGVVQRIVGDADGSRITKDILLPLLAGGSV